MMNRLILALLVCCLTLQTWAQTTELDHKAFLRTKASAEKGSAEAQLQLGELYANGQGVTKDLQKAFKWHRKAAEQGLARAEYQLGLDYSDGEGVKRNVAEAVKWFERAAEQGLVDAQYELGLCFVSGRGIRANEVEGIKWLRKAAAQGSVIAEYQIGICYLQGTGVAKDVEDGIKWIESAAMKGNALSQNQLATCYERGEGVPKDEVQAYKWYSLAGAQDDEHALDIKVSIAKLEAKMTKDQIAQAQHLAREFKPGQEKAGKTDTGPASTTSGREVSDSAPSEPGKSGLVTVNANELDCEVFIDGAFVGNSPAKLTLPEGQHSVEVKKSGFRDYRRDLKVMAGSALTLTPRLEKE